VGEAQGKLIKVKVKPSPTTFHRCLKSKISRSRLKKSRFISTKSRFISTKSRLLTNISKNLVLSRFVSKVSISLDDLDKNLDTSLSRLKSLDFKNLDRDKMKVDLDRRENLDGFQKLVSTLRTFSISISICLDVETPKLNNYRYTNHKIIVRFRFLFKSFKYRNRSSLKT
jgi:hypothetical protein